MSSLTADASFSDPGAPDRSEDDTDRGWGDDDPTAADAHEEWLRRQRPPHHGD